MPPSSEFGFPLPASLNSIPLGARPPPPSHPPQQSIGSPFRPLTDAMSSPHRSDPTPWDTLALRWLQIISALRVTFETCELNPPKSTFKGECYLVRASRWGALYRFGQSCEIRAPFTFKIHIYAGTFLLSTEEVKKNHIIYGDGFDRTGKIWLRLVDNILSDLTLCLSAGILAPFTTIPLSVFDAQLSAKEGQLSSRFTPCPLQIEPPLRLHQVHPSDPSTAAKDSEYVSVYGRYTICIAITSIEGNVLFEEILTEQYVSHLASPYLPTIAIECTGFPRPFKSLWDQTRPLLADVLVYRFDHTLLWGSTSFLHATRHPVLTSLHTLTFIPEEDRSTFEMVVSSFKDVPFIQSCRIVLSPTKPSKSARSHSKLLDISLSALKVRPIKPSNW